MAKTIVADAGPLIALAHLDLFHLAPILLGELLVPEIVVEECLNIPSRADAIVIQAALDKRHLTALPNPHSTIALPPSLGAGESAVITMAQQLCTPVLLDDKLARRAASVLNIPVIGTAGALIKGKQTGEIPQVKPLLEKLKRKGYHMSSKLIQRILELAGEG